MARLASVPSLAIVRAFACAVLGLLAAGAATPLGAQEVPVVSQPPRPLEPPPPAYVQSPGDISGWLDTAAVRAALTVLPPHGDTSRVAHLVRISWDSTGAPVSFFAPAGYLMPKAWRDSVMTLLRAHVRPVAAERGQSSAHLFIESGADARVELTTVRETPARVADVGRMTRLLQRESSDLVRDDDSLLGRSFSVRVAIRVAADGSIESHNISRSSGRADLDAAALRIIGQTRFTPTVLEGVAIRSLAVQPIRFVFPDD